MATNTVVTDLGRCAVGRGLASNGAQDQRSAMLANALVGNEFNAPLLENTAGELTLRVDGDLLIALTGAPANTTVNGTKVPYGAPISVRADDIVRIAPTAYGLRTYLSVRGSFPTPRLYGSCAPDDMISFGVRLTPNSDLDVRATTPTFRFPHGAPPIARLLNDQDSLGLLFPSDGSTGTALNPIVIDATVGPDRSQFSSTLDRLYFETYEVTVRSNAMGVRLRGFTPERLCNTELLSRGVPPGAVEIPGGDEIIVLHRARSITAGYAIPAVATQQGLDRLAQARPGDHLRFRPVTERHAALQLRRDRAALQSIQNRARTLIRHNIEPCGL